MGARVDIIIYPTRTPWPSPPGVSVAVVGTVVKIFLKIIKAHVNTGVWGCIVSVGIITWDKMVTVTAEGVMPGETGGDFSCL